MTEATFDVDSGRFADPAGRHLRAELGRLTALLAARLAAQRGRGRTPLGDAVGGTVIEEGEAEGLVAELASRWREGASTEPRAPAPADPVTREAESAAARGDFLPLIHARRTFELGRREYDALLLALAVELDPGFGRLVAYLNDHVAHTRPTVGLAFGPGPGPDSGSDGAWPPDLLRRPLVRDGLLALVGEGPLPGRSLELAPGMAGRLAGGGEGAVEEGIAIHPPEPGLLARLVLEEPVRRSVESWASAWRRGGGGARTLILVGAAGSGRTSLARAAAAELGLPLVAVEVGLAPAAARRELLTATRREVRWTGAAALLEAAGAELAPGDWERLRAALDGLEAPLVVAVSPEQAAAAAEGGWEGACRVALEEPGREQRARLWRALAPRGHGLDERCFDELAARFAFHPGRIRRALKRAEADLALQPAGERRLTPERLLAACRATGAAAMGDLAQKLPRPFTFDDLVIPEDVREELDLALAWVRHPATVLDRWGLARRVPFGYGLSVLFSGPPGTGKTMAAQVLARELGLDVYRIDLSQVMSKFIGETERNLARLFDEAHASGSILFFDEADAIFGKRSEVKDAHDRYANVEIGYLLQRLEQHDGVTVLATNRRQDLDEAFLRRFHVIVGFPMPSAEDRRRIWEGMMPEGVPREPGLDLGPLAERFEISGGEIRNCVLAAAFLAAEDDAPVGRRHLKRALRRELKKSGRFVDAKELEGLD